MARVAYSGDPNAALKNMPLVSPAMHSVNNPLESRNYIKLATNRVFECEPDVLHFAGFEVDQMHSRMVRIKNVSARGARLHLIAPQVRRTPLFVLLLLLLLTMLPQSEFFRIVRAQSGLVAPGMAEEVELIFTPTEWRYYYDCLRIHSEGQENLLVPIHGYPVIEGLAESFPQAMDFGAVPVGRRAVQSIDLNCAVPVNFEYECELLDPVAEFGVIGAMAGVVPALGRLSIEVAFSPTRFATLSARLRVKVSQFGQDPFVITLRGSSSPGLAKDQAMAASSASTMLGGSNVISGDGGVAMGITGGGGGGRADLVSMHLANTQRMERSQAILEGTIKAGELVYPQDTLPNFRPGTPEEVVDGIVMPGNLAPGNMVASNSVLNSIPGKRTIKDLKAELARAAADKAAKEASGADMGRQLQEGGAMGRQVKEAQFMAEVQAVEHFEQEKELKWFVCIGEKPVSEAYTADALEDRAFVEQAYQEREDDADRERRDAYHGEARRGERVQFDAAETLEVEPTFEEKPMTPIRQFAKERFRNAARIVCVRIRADKRLEELGTFFNKVGRTRAQVREAIRSMEDEDVARQIFAKVGEGDADAVPFQMRESSVAGFAFPVYREAEFATNGELAVCDFPSTPWGRCSFDDAATVNFTLSVPKESDIMGYKPYPLPITEQMFRSDPTKGCGGTEAVRYGALEESYDRAEVALAAAEQEVAEQVVLEGGRCNPAPTLELPVVAHSFGSELPPVAQGVAWTETMQAYPLRPDQPEMLGDADTDTRGTIVNADNVSRSMKTFGSPSLFDNWRPTAGDAASGAVVMIGGVEAPLPALMSGPSETDEDFKGVGADTEPEPDALLEAMRKLRDESLASVEGGARALTTRELQEAQIDAATAQRRREHVQRVQQRLASLGGGDK